MPSMFCSGRVSLLLLYVWTWSFDYNFTLGCMATDEYSFKNHRYEVLTVYWSIAENVDTI